MTIWHIMMGVGLGLIATIITIVANGRALPTSSRTAYGENTWQNEICNVCLRNPSNNEIKKLPCGHVVHKGCFRKLMENTTNTCPKCGKDVTISY